MRNIKWYLSTKIAFKRDKEDGTEEKTNAYFRSKTYVLVQEDDIENNLNEAFQKMNQSLEEFVHMGSSWQVDQVLGMEINCVEYAPIEASSYMELPNKIRLCHSVINVKNHDKKCFLWSVLAALHPQERNPQLVEQYKKYEEELNMKDIPIKIERFEQLNQISINVFGFEKDDIFPLYITKLSNGCKEVDLLYLSDEQNQHYCWIKNLDRFLRQTNKMNKHFYCRRCLHGFVKKEGLENHKPYCDKFDFQRIVYPKIEESTLEFKNRHKQIRVPFVIYADFETLNKPMDSCSPDPNSSSTTNIVQFEACGYAYQVVCSNDNLSKRPVVYRGEDAVDHFLQSLMKEELEIKKILNESEPLIMTKETEQLFLQATNCYVCNRKFDEHLIKVRDHSHVGLSGDKSDPKYSNFRGASCQSCNLSLKNPNFVPVVIHNCRGFDSHLIMKAVGHFKEEIKVIANNMKKYISFSVGNLRFLDSYQFMQSSLEMLIENLAQDGLKYFKQFQRVFPSQKTAEFLLRKNVYCYDYIDSHDKFKETKLPPKEKFFNQLKDKHITDEDYEHVQRVWTKLNMKTLGDLHDHYVITDVLLLADVMERFRDMCMENYSLDCLHYYTSPGLSYDAALKMTEVCLDLITDPMMYNMFELGTRGGISMITKKFARANNPYIKDSYDPNLPNNYIMYFDANNLYGWAMSQPLPIGAMRFLSEDEIQRFDVKTIPSNNNKGYTLEVDLSYPTRLHDSHNDYPLTPIHKIVKDEELSNNSKNIWNRFNGNIKRVPTAKLIPTLEDKKKYILHYETLKLYIQLGLEVTKIHRIIEYDQSPWLKKYIDFNAQMRSKARNDFERDFYKLMCNSVYGKTMENLRKRIDVRLVNDNKKLKKYVAKPSFHRFVIFNQDLVGVELKKVKLILNRPSYLGASILDLSKNLMTNFHHNIMKPRYGSDIELLFTDTDSLCYDIKTEDIYEDMKSFIDCFDTSNYKPGPTSLQSDKYKKVPGKFKDELAGKPIKEFIGLRPKMYSLIYNVEDKLDEFGGLMLLVEKEKSVSKGISKVAKETQLRHENFRDCLLRTKSTIHEMKLIRSERHQLHMNNIVKRGLSNFDDKRFWDGIYSLAFGHYKLK